MKQEIVKTKLWGEFLEWSEFNTYEGQVEITEYHTMLDKVIMPIGALIGLLEQFCFDVKGITIIISPYVGYGEEECVTKENPLGYCGLILGTKDLSKPHLTPLQAKAEAIYQYFKSKG